MIEKYQHFIFIILLLLIAGCEKWNDSPQSETKGFLVKVENEEHEVIEKYEYNRNKNLESSWHKMFYFFENSKAEYEYQYNSKGLLLKKEGYEPGNPIMSSLVGALGKDVSYTYEYDLKNKLTRMQAEFDFGEYSDINYSMNYIYEYPNDSIIIERINNIDELANSVTNVNEYYFSKAGNLVKKQTYQDRNSPDKKFLSLEEYLYDNKKSYINLDAIRQSKNNTTEVKTTAYNYDENDVQSIAYTSIFKYKYAYNSDGYPESMTETYPNGQIIIKYYFYKN